MGRARRAGVTRVWAQVSPRLEPARELFRTAGFRESGRLETRYWGEEVALLELPV